ncbi:MAG: transcription antitermination factor NusB [Phycisphaerales bacterium]
MTAEPATSTRPTSAREAATLALGRQTTRFPDLLPLRPDDSALAPRDAALASAIYDAAIRRWLTLEHVLEAFAKPSLRRLEAPLRAVLLAGAAQALLLDRLPAYAIIDESVELAKRLIRPGAGGLVNAVLRRVIETRGDRAAIWADEGDVPVDRLPLSDGGALGLRSTHLPNDESKRWAAAFSLPTWLIDRWKAEHGAVAAWHMARHTLIEPPTILNIAHGTPPKRCSPHDSPGSAVWTGPRAELGAAVGAGSDVWVQDPASSASVAAITDLTPTLIVDLCAGQGTKTRQLLAAFPNAGVLATDADPDRLATLRAAVSDQPRAEVVPLDAIESRAGGRADLVVLDVPCSNTGVLARRLEARYRASPTQLARLVELQRQIISMGTRLRSPSGRILYATCSIERDENQSQAAWMADRFGLRVERESLRLPRGKPGGDPRDYADGSYHALLG